MACALGLAIIVMAADLDCDGYVSKPIDFGAL